ncbi:MAG TPA: hypothetical protein VNT02_03255, partial [Burkholderiales bacterium]|nr:hypothetical protein [Burkholderiales bacterium]
ALSTTPTSWPRIDTADEISSDSKRFPAHLRRRRRKTAPPGGPLTIWHTCCTRAGRSIIVHGELMKSILDRSFRYRSSVETDLKATFARLRRQQQKQAKAAPHHPAAVKVVQIQARERAQKP